MLRFVVLAACLAIGTASCHRADASAEPAPATTAPEVTDQTKGLLLTWIDDKGEFHVEQKVGDVPMVSRDPVRVADPANEAPPGKVYLADLRNPVVDGKYKVRLASRDEFENIAEERRKKNGVAILTAQPPASPDPPPAPSGSTDVAPPTSRPTVIIYGASWCGPCHQAQAYLKKRNIPFVDKDIEEDPAAAKEMRAKLTKAGMRNGSIPVIDVKGKLLIGFDPGSIERALAAP
jgi:glutaredoxin